MARYTLRSFPVLATVPLKVSLSAADKLTAEPTMATIAMEMINNLVILPFLFL